MKKRLFAKTAKVYNTLLNQTFLEDLLWLLKICAALLTEISPGSNHFFPANFQVFTSEPDSLRLSSVYPLLLHHFLGIRQTFQSLNPISLVKKDTQEILMDINRMLYSIVSEEQ